VVEAEVRTASGKLDLLGGAIYALFVLIVLTEVILVGAGRFFLRVSGREIEAPEFGGGQALLLVFGVPVYFLISVWMTRPSSRRQ
jgi:hypothetical protein